MGPFRRLRTSALEQALSQITSGDEAVREAALRVVIEQGDSTSDSAT